MQQGLERHQVGNVGVGLAHAGGEVAGQIAVQLRAALLQPLLRHVRRLCGGGGGKDSSPGKSLAPPLLTEDVRRQLLELGCLLAVLLVDQLRHLRPQEAQRLLRILGEKAIVQRK